jgi:succinylarginine dihydrolase
VIARPALASSAMWAANAATISPSADCGDGRLHATVANLQTMLHRILEAEQTERTLRNIGYAAACLQSRLHFQRVLHT